MAKPINQLMQKKMTRKEFILTLFLLLVAILGFGKIIELLTGHSLPKNLANSSPSPLDYSGGDYGGKTEGSKITSSTEDYSS